MTRKGRRVEAIIFDLDDTLLDWSGQSAAWDEITRPLADNVYSFLEEQGHKLPGRDRFFEQLNQSVEDVWEEAKQDFSGAFFGDALARACAEAGIDAGSLDMEAMMRAYDWQPVPGVALYDDALCVLDTLRQHGYKIGLITNSFFPMWMRDVELHHYDLIDYFDARITSGDTGYMKPHPAIYERMLSLLETSAEHAIFVGDRPQNDIIGANEAGLVSVLIDPPHLQRDQDGVAADYTITTLSELLDIIETLEREEQ